MPVFLIPRFPFEGSGTLTIMQAGHFRALGEQLKLRRWLHASWGFYGEHDRDHAAVYLLGRGMGFEGSEIERMWIQLRQDPLLTVLVDAGIHGEVATPVVMVSQGYLHELLTQHFPPKRVERAGVEPGSLWIVTSLPPKLVAVKTAARNQ